MNGDQQPTNTAPTSSSSFQIEPSDSTTNLSSPATYLASISRPSGTAVHSHEFRGVCNAVEHAHAPLTNGDSGSVGERMMTFISRAAQADKMLAEEFTAGLAFSLSFPDRVRTSRPPESFGEQVIYAMNALQQQEAIGAFQNVQNVWRARSESWQGSTRVVSVSWGNRGPSVEVKVNWELQDAGPAESQDGA